MNNITKIILFKKQHLEKTFLWMQDKELKRCFLLRREISECDHLKWYENYLLDGSQRIFAIEWNDQHIGNCGLKNINMIDKKAELWIYFGETNIKGTGLSKQVVKRLLSYTFDELNMNKAYLHVADFNAPAIRLYKSIGFVTEGTFERDYLMEDVFITIIRMSLFKENFNLG
jgi:RimJ/RimL family protein N-acetyltransferase